MESQKENDARKAKEEARRKLREDGGEFDEEEYDRQLSLSEDAENGGQDTEPTPPGPRTSMCR